MRTLIVYYSRTGITQKVAKSLGAMIAADFAEIHCDRYRPGFFGRSRAILDAIRGRLPPIELPRVDYKAYDLVVIGGPIWAGRAAVPIRAFLAGHHNLPGKIALFLTHIGSPAERAFADMDSFLASPAEVKLLLKSKDIQDMRIGDALLAFATQLTRKQAA